jgi:hypothetical protein
MSAAQQTSISFVGQLSGTAGSTKASEGFGNFEATKSYVIRILLSTFDVNVSSPSYGIGFAIASTAGSPGITSSYLVSNGTQYLGTNKNLVSIVADVVINGASTTEPYSLIITLTSGANGAASISVFGTYTRIQVGSIG